MRTVGFGVTVEAELGNGRGSGRDSRGDARGRVLQSDAPRDAGECRGAIGSGHARFDAEHLRRRQIWSRIGLMRQVIVTADESGERAGRRMINHVLSEPARRCRDQHGGNPGIDQRPQHVQYAIRPRHPLELLLGDVIDHRLGNLLGRQIRPVLDHRFRAMVKRSARTGPR